MKKLILAVFLLLGALNLYGRNGLVMERYDKNDCEGTPTYSYSDNINHDVGARNSVRYTGYIYAPNDDEKKNRILLNIREGGIKGAWSRIIVDANPKEKYCKRNQPKNDGKSIVVSPGLHRIEAYSNAGPVAKGNIQLCWATESGSAYCEPKDVIESKYFFPHKFAILGFDTDFQTTYKPSESKTINARLELSTKLQSALSVNLTFSDESAKNGIDYKPKTTSVAIEQGSKSIDIPIEILNSGNWDNNVESKKFKIKINPITANGLKDEADETIGEIITQSGEIIKTNNEITIQIKKNIESKCAILPDTNFNESDVDTRYLWRKIFDRDTMSGSLIFKDRPLFGTNWNIQEDLEFKIKNDDINNNKVSNAEGHRIKIIKPGTTSGNPHKTGYSQGITNIQPLDFKNKIFEIDFDYYAYNGKDGEMALILYDGSQDIAVLSQGDDTGRFGYKTRNKNKKGKQAPFTTSPNGQFKDYGLGWLAIGFSLKEGKVTVLGNIQNPYFDKTNGEIKSDNHKEIVIANNVSLHPNKDGFVGKFKIRIDNTKKGKSLLTIHKQTKNIDKENVYGNGEKIFEAPINLLVSGQRTPPEKIKVAFSASFPTYTNNSKLLQEIGNVTTCPDRSADDGISFKVVEREFAKFYEKNKDKTINGVKYDFNWLWNSPLRTKIAGGAPKKPYDKNIGYEYCVIASKDKGKTPTSYKDGIYLSYAKASRNKDIIKELLDLKDGEELSMNKYFLKEEQLTKTTKKDLTDAKLVYSDRRELNLDIKADKPTSACFTLHKDFTKNNITSHMIFNVYKNDAKMLTDIDFEKNQGKTNASNNAFAIRPAGFYAQFTPKIYENNKFNKDEDDEITLPNKNYLKENLDTNETSYITYPLKDINSTATLHADKIYEVDIFPVALNITKKTDDKSKDPKYTYNLEKLEKTYINTFDTSKENLEAILPNKAGCSDENNITLGKITNKERSRFIFQGGSINYENYLSDLTETIPVFATTQPKLYLKHNNVMKFQIKAYDMGWTYANYRDIYRYNKNKSRDKKDKLTKNLQKYGFQCKFDKDDEIYKDFKNIANKNFEDELVSCKTEFINPNLIEFIPNTFDIYLTRILNQSNIDKDSKSGGFTYYNDLMSEIKDHTQIYTENQMSAKLQLIIAASDGKGNAYSNFTNKCYAKDVIFKLSYIGDRNFQYREKIIKNDITGLSKKEKNLMQNVINVFNKNPDTYTENKEFVAGNINQKTEFVSYMKYKEKTILSDEIKKILEKKSISKDEEKMLNTAKISFNVDGFYQYNKNLTSDKFCKDLNDTEKCLIKIISSHKNEDDIKADMDKNLNKYRNSYKIEKIKDGSSWREFDFDKFDEASVNIQISKNFFNDEIEFINEDYKKVKLERPGATAVMVGFNLGRDKNPMNPTKVFIRDFIPSSLWTVLDENRLQINNTKIIKNPYHKEIKPVVHYNKHNNNQSGLFYYGSAYANDAKGPRKGVNNKVYYATYCKKEKNDCNEFGISTSYENTVPIILNWYKSHDYTPSKTTDDGDILKFIPNSKDETKTVTTKTNILDKDGTQPIKTTPKNNTITEDTITMETPSYLRYHEKFHVEFVKENKNTWFGEGGAGERRDSKEIGNVLGTGENKDGKFDKNLNKESKRVFW